MHHQCTSLVIVAIIYSLRGKVNQHAIRPASSTQDHSHSPIMGHNSHSAPAANTAERFEFPFSQASFLQASETPAATTSYWQPHSPDAGYFASQVASSSGDASPMWSAQSISPVESNFDPGPENWTPEEQAAGPPVMIRTSPQLLKKKISRPPNAWIIYRSEKIQEIKAQAEIRTPQAELSKLIAERWRSEPPEIKQRYEHQARVIKLEHDEQNPGWRSLAAVRT